MTLTIDAQDRGGKGGAVLEVTDVRHVDGVGLVGGRVAVCIVAGKLCTITHPSPARTDTDAVRERVPAASGVADLLRVRDGLARSRRKDGVSRALGLAATG
jgi:hypothetical protein